MALSPCNTTVDAAQRELASHGTADFPIACYHDDLGSAEVPWHWHEELEAVVISHGRCTVAAGGEKFTLEAGEGFFINSQILHGCWDLDASACRFHSLVFHPRLVGGSADSVFFRRYLAPLTENHALEGLCLTPKMPWQAQALEAIERAWQACVDEGRGYEFAVRSALSELVALLCENLSAPQVQTGAQRDEDRIKQMLRFIHDHSAEPLKIGDIARAAAVSESECLRCFRHTIGSTPIAYLRSYRLRKAAQMLSETAEPVCCIAELCGFQDVSYFTKTFREQRGCTPTEYRRSKSPKR